MRASSFANWMGMLHPGEADVQIHKCLENTHGLYSFGVGFYNWIQRTAPWLHHLYFNFLEVSAICGSKERILGAKRFCAILDHVKPQVILSTHGTLNHGFFEIAKERLGADRVRCVTYCGELFGRYGFSRHWVNPDTDLFIGAVQETCEMAVRLGMDRSRVREGGFLLHPSFYEPALTPEARVQFLEDDLGLDGSSERFTLLLSTGEHGAHNHPAVLEALYASRRWLDIDRLQVIALCGRNPEVLANVRRWIKGHPGLSVRALPRSEKMATFMKASSAIVSRPGTGTTSEAILSECPLIFNGIGGIMPQEWITVKYTRSHHLAEQMRRPTDLPLIIKRWFDVPEMHQEIRENMIRNRPSRHPNDILKMVLDLGTTTIADVRGGSTFPSRDAAKI
jgi:processive 1,2-diacylglycerol beta-glucosyltransferase